jgi:N-acetyl-alpha-D-glucosaminyl L-malate synthase BshA
MRQKYGEPHEKLLLHISNFRPVKRPLDVVSIFAKVQEQIPARLLLVGDGPELPKVMERARARGLTDRVHFLGKQDEVAQLISLADLLLLPSEKESFGLVALEAMACGVPTVASNAGGIPEVVEHGRTGFLSPVGDIEDMARNAVRLLQDEAMYQSFSEAGLKRVKTHFCGMRIAAQYEAVYERVIGNPS